ncbi:hypothetical protein V6N12_042308 [Hibiscus sabdariffa]|uniref:Uncharacterized protein n=1 Tax=Hibiscus sabdariffa TaxID=183260 RepID=A0ABR2EER7_9ROSI
MIKPIKGLFQWDPVTDMEPILPPIIRRPLGRPVKKRKLEPDESQEPQQNQNPQQPQQPRQNQQPQQPQQPYVPRRKIFPIIRQQPFPPPTTMRWLPSQESTVTNPPTQVSQSSTRE